MMANVRTPEEAFGIKNDYSKKLAMTLDQMEEMIYRISEINGVSDKSLSPLVMTPHFRNLLNYQPSLPYSAEDGEINIPLGKRFKYKS